MIGCALSFYLYSCYTPIQAVCSSKESCIITHMRIFVLLKPYAWTYLALVHVRAMKTKNVGVAVTNWSRLQIMKYVVLFRNLSFFLSIFSNSGLFSYTASKVFAWQAGHMQS